MLHLRSRRDRAILAVLLVAAAIVVTVDFREPPGGPVDQLQRGALAVLGPLQRGVSALVSPVSDFLTGLHELGSLRERNRELEAEVARLREHERVWQDLLSENERLRGVLGMAGRCRRGSAECRTVGAQVVATTGSSYQWSVTINVGSAQGVAEGMAVIGADGLVGRVTRVSGGYATVMLLTDPTSGVAARLARTRAAGLVRGTGDGRLVFDPVAADTSVRVGDTVVSQAYEGGVFPDGIPIGVVSKLEPSASGLVQRALVQPYVRPGSLDVVAVVVEHRVRAGRGH